MRACLVALIALGGCDYVWRIDHWPDGRPPLPDSDFVPPDVGACAGTLVGHQTPATGLFAYCVKGTPAPSFIIADGFDTSSNPLCDDVVFIGGIDLCIKVANTIAMTGAAKIKGSRPLVLIGLQQIVIDSALSLAAKTNGDTGPGSDSVMCTSAAGASDTKGGSGGGGGSFGTKGGSGGQGHAIGGSALDVAPPDRIRGGCAGGDGGDGAIANGGTGAGGHSGGALYLISPGQIQITANVNASGSGGLGGHAGQGTATGGGGGGGGGSGGMIGLDAPMLDLPGNLVANGGGGGGGGGAGTAGNNGTESTGATYLMHAAGGPATGDGGGKGGDGAAVDTQGQNGMQATAGGGGGGGEGYILIYTTGPMPTFKASPTPRINGV